MHQTLLVKPVAVSRQVHDLLNVEALPQLKHELLSLRRRHRRHVLRSDIVSSPERLLIVRRSRRSETEEREDRLEQHDGRLG